MSQPAHVIPFETAEGPTMPKKGFTRLDNATDLQTLAGLPNALVKPYLLLLSRREMRQKGVGWAEVAEFCGRSQPQASAALKALGKLGLAFPAHGLWFADSEAAAQPAPPYRKTSIPEPAPYRKTSTDIKENLYGFKGNPLRRDENTPSETTKNEPLKEVRTEGRTEEDVIRGDLDESAGYARDITLIREAGLLKPWSDWVALGSLKRPTQQAHAAIWAEWIRAGRADALRAEAQHITESGTYGFPLGALKKRMADGLNTISVTAFENVSAAARQAFRPGQRVRYPDGSEALVVSVLSRGIATDHPTLPDVPLGRLKTLEVL